MNKQATFQKQQKRLTRLTKRAESGFSITIQGLYYTMLLFIVFALIFDFGNVGYVQSIGSNAVRVAAQDAAKDIDPNVFLDTQEVRLATGALGRAQDVVDGMTNGLVSIDSISVNSLQTRDVIVVRGTATADLPVLNSLFGFAPVAIPLEAYAEPAFGIEEEGQ